MTFVSPEYIEHINGYAYYRINKYIPAGDFYIGWQQVDPDIINVGFDLNNNAQSKIFYNTTDSWQNTSYAGALMMRPYMGKYFIDPNVGITEQSEISVKLLPIPADNYLNISTSSHFSYYKIVDITGKVILEDDYTNVINISNLSAGIYFLILNNDQSQQFASYKFIKK